MANMYHIPSTPHYDPGLNPSQVYSLLSVFQGLASLHTQYRTDSRFYGEDGRLKPEHNDSSSIVLDIDMKKTREAVDDHDRDFTGTWYIHDPVRRQVAGHMCRNIYWRCCSWCRVFMASPKPGDHEFVYKLLELQKPLVVNTAMMRGVLEGKDAEYRQNVERLERARLSTTSAGDKGRLLRLVWERCLQWQEICIEIMHPEHLPAEAEKEARPGRLLQ